MFVEKKAWRARKEICPSSSKTKNNKQERIQKWKSYEKREKGMKIEAFVCSFECYTKNEAKPILNRFRLQKGKKGKK